MVFEAINRTTNELIEKATDDVCKSDGLNASLSPVKTGNKKITRLEDCCEESDSEPEDINADTIVLHNQPNSDLFQRSKQRQRDLEERNKSAISTSNAFQSLEGSYHEGVNLEVVLNHNKTPKEVPKSVDTNSPAPSGKNASTSGEKPFSVKKKIKLTSKEQILHYNRHGY